MKSTVKKTYQQSRNWMMTLIQSLFFATCLHLIISSYQWTQVGFDEAYTHVLLQTQTEQQIVFGLHPEITLGLIGTMELLRTWFASTIENFFHRHIPHPKGLNVSANKNHWITKATSWWSAAYTFAKNLILLAWQNTLVVWYKGVVFVYALPLLLLSSGIGAIDGLIHREIRTQEMGRESSFLFHKFSTLSSKCLSSLLMLYFLLPLALSVTFFLLPMAGLTCFLSAQTCRHLKKYL